MLPSGRVFGAGSGTGRTGLPLCSGFPSALPRHWFCSTFVFVVDDPFLLKPNKPQTPERGCLPGGARGQAGGARPPDRCPRSRVWGFLLSEGFLRPPPSFFRFHRYFFIYPSGRDRDGRMDLVPINHGNSGRRGPDRSSACRAAPRFPGMFRGWGRRRKRG